MAPHGTLKPTGNALKCTFYRHIFGKSLVHVGGGYPLPHPPPRSIASLLQEPTNIYNSSPPPPPTLLAVCM